MLLVHGRELVLRIQHISHCLHRLRICASILEKVPRRHRLMQQQVNENDFKSDDVSTSVNENDLKSEDLCTSDMWTEFEQMMSQSMQEINEGFYKQVQYFFNCGLQNIKNE